MTSIFTDPKAYADSESWHAVAARLRREDPVCRIEAPDFPPFYAVTRHADLIEVERQPERFKNTARSVLAPLSRPGPDSMVKTLIGLDGEEHRAYRGMTNEWFKPGNIRRSIEPRIRGLAREFVDRMAALGGECDFALDVARHYPLRAIMSILGVRSPPKSGSSAPKIRWVRSSISGWSDSGTPRMLMIARSG